MLRSFYECLIENLYRKIFFQVMARMYKDFWQIVFFQNVSSGNYVY